MVYVTIHYQRQHHAYWAPESKYMKEGHVFKGLPVAR